MSLKHGCNEQLLDRSGLCLLSLDGGGVRGLSTLYILKAIMSNLNDERRKSNLPRVKPCEIFDLIGGTSTGGLIAIMLGRFGMEVDECIEAYSELMRSVFERKAHVLPVGLRGLIQARFSSTRLKKAMVQVLKSRGISEEQALCDEPKPGCRVFVCATAKETGTISLLRNYSVPGEVEPRATILQAALATSAATTFFKPVTISTHAYVDGALGANNPVNQVEHEACNIWCPQTGNLKPLVKCFISIGTGNSGIKAVEDNLFIFLSRTLTAIATENKKTAELFASRWREHFEQKRYFRFNVEQGLQEVKLAEHRKKGTIVAATHVYLEEQEAKLRVRDCVLNLKYKEEKTSIDFASVATQQPSRSTTWTAHEPHESLWNVPFERNSRFVGRESLLAEIEGKILSLTPNSCTRCAIFGLGGVGKTQIALELAFRMRDTKLDYSIFWVPVTSVENFEQGYLEIGRKLQIGGLDDDTQDVKRLVQHCLNQDISGRWLLILDNSDDTDLLFGRQGPKSFRLLDYLPSSKNGCIIFTTRSRAAAVDLAQNNIFHVPEMNEETGIQSLRKILIDQTSLSDEAVVRKLLTKLTFLPLAIVQAAAYMNKNNVDVATYLSLLENCSEDRQENDLIELFSKDFEDEGRYRDTQNPVVATWQVSFERIRKNDPQAADLLSFMSCLDPKAIPEQLLPSLGSKVRLLDAIGTLTGHSFVTKRSSDDSVDLHGLVKLATRNWLRSQGILQEWTEKVISRLSDIFPDCEHKNRATWRKFLPHAQLVASEFKGRRDDKIIRLLLKIGLCLLSDGRYDEAESHLLEVAEARKAEMGLEHPETLDSLRHLALNYRKQGNFKTAMELDTLVLEKSKEKLGPEHPETLKSQSNLCLTLQCLWKWEEAEKLGVEVVKLRKEKLGSEHLDTISSMSDLVWTYHKQFRFAEAGELGEYVCKLRTQILTQDHPDTLTSMSHLAANYQQQGRMEEAEKLKIVVMETRSRVLGAEHPSTLSSMVNLALTYRFQERLQEAERLEDQVLKARKRILGNHHASTLTSMHNLAWTYVLMGRTQEASAIMEECVELSIETLGIDHPTTRTRMWAKRNLNC